MLFLSALRPVRFASLCSARSGRFAPSYLAALFLIITSASAFLRVRRSAGSKQRPAASVAGLPLRPGAVGPTASLWPRRAVRAVAGAPAPLPSLRGVPRPACSLAAPCFACPRPPLRSLRSLAAAVGWLARRAPRSLRARGASAQRSRATRAGFFFGSAQRGAARARSGSAALAGRARAALTAACSVSQIDAFSSILTLFGTAKSVTIWEPSHTRRRQQLRAGSCTGVHSALRADITLTMINLASQLLLWCAGLRQTHA